jgi:pyruvate dehydrogenase E2 component (dihydrolipoamide acetyltransferase)
VKVGDEIGSGALVARIEAEPRRQRRRPRPRRQGCQRPPPAAAPAGPEIATPAKPGTSSDDPIVEPVAVSPAPRRRACCARRRARAVTDCQCRAPARRRRTAARQPALMPARPCACSRASSAWTSRKCAAANAAAASRAPTCRASSSPRWRAAVPRPAVRGGTGGLQLIPWPQVDFAKFGAVTRQPRTRINKLSAANLARNWAMIPHVTQFDEADITEMEAFRKTLGAEQKDVKVTPLVFLIKAVVAALKKYRTSMPRSTATNWCSSSTSTSASPWTRPTGWWSR